MRAGKNDLLVADEKDFEGDRFFNEATSVRGGTRGALHELLDELDPADPPTIEFNVSASGRTGTRGAECPGEDPLATAEFIIFASGRSGT